MKRIISYISALALGAALLAGCTKGFDENSFEGEGSVSFDMNFDGAITRALVSAPENVVVKIGVPDVGYTHIFTGLNNVPSELWLASGNYFAEVTGGVAQAPSFTENYTFRGYEAFTVTDGAKTSVAVECRITTTLVSVKFDSSLDEWLTAYELKLFPTPGSSSNFVFDATHKYPETVVYANLEDKQTAMDWTFTATNKRQHEGPVTKTGTFSGLQAGKRYNATIKYSYVDKVGTFEFDITVDESLVEITHDIVISQKPAFEGLDLAVPVAPIDGQVLGVTSGAGIQSIVFSEGAFGTEYKIVEGGNVVMAEGTLSGDGIAVASTDRGFALTFGRAFFRKVVAAGNTPVKITVTDPRGRTNEGYLTSGPGAAIAPERGDIWAGHVDAKGFILDETLTDPVQFAYRTVGGAWSYVDAAKNGSEYTAKIPGLTPETAYEMDLKIGSDLVGVIRTFTTDAAPQMPNSSFDAWFSASSKWYPGTSTTDQYWDTANKGIAASQQPTLPVSNLVELHPGAAEGDQGAYMKPTVYFSKFAAGNLYTGIFGSITLVPVGANVKFGRPFTGRPTSLKGWLKANPGAITHSTLAEKPTGSTDEFQIYVMLTDWTDQRVVNTGSVSTLIDNAANYVIAYGDIAEAGFTNTQVYDWTEFEIPITWRDDRIPSYIVVVACTSKYGDYFTGSTNSELWVDDFELVYE